jgi:hypothetical protein
MDRNSGHKSVFADRMDKRSGAGSVVSRAPFQSPLFSSRQPTIMPTELNIRMSADI